MKATLLFNRTVWFLLAVTQGQSIKCYTCHDSEHNPSCKRRMNKTDCSLEAKFGDVFDSCFSMIAINGKTKIQIKDCAIGFGCKELEDVLCENFTRNKQNSTWNSCRVECCEGDYCNKYVFGQSNSARILTTQTILLSSFVIICYFLAFVSPW